jgi:hypothetical protein
VTSLDTVSERGKGKGKVGQRPSSRNSVQATEIVAPDVLTTSAAVLTLASVPPLSAPPPEHDTGALDASLTLASLSMLVLEAGVLGPGQVAQLPGSPGTRADIPAGAESTTEQDKEEQRKKSQAARKRRQRENERAVAQVTSPTTASTALATTPTSASVVEKAHHASPRCSPRKSQVPPGAVAMGNWSAFCEVRRERDGGFRGGSVGRLCVMIKLYSAMQALMTMGALEIARLMGPCSMSHLFTSMPKEPSIVILREL